MLYSGGCEKLRHQSKILSRHRYSFTFLRAQASSHEVKSPCMREKRVKPNMRELNSSDTLSEVCFAIGETVCRIVMRAGEL